MVVRWTWAVAPLLSLAATACAGTPPAEPAEPPHASAAPASLWSGIYTDAQAERGAAAYAESCSSCHAADLRGSSNAPSLVGVSFLFLWEDRSLDELFSVVRTEMPTNAPNSLPASTYLEILTHILEANGVPAGERELAADHDHLSTIRITGPEARSTR